MSPISTIRLSFILGVGAVVIGLIIFAINWNVWGGGMPGYKFFLFPGNLTLTYIWHPIFTEEMAFWPKLFVHMIGQFTVVSLSTALTVATLRQLRNLS